MITPDQAAKLAEVHIVEYAQLCQLQTPGDVQKALEMLISTAARAIECYAGTTAALDVLNRTIFHMLPPVGGKS